MTEVRTSSLCERPCAGIEDTLEASIGTGGPQSVFDAAMAPTQESGLRENCTSRLSERAEAGRTLHLSRLYSYEAGEQSERAHCGGIYRGKRSGAGGAKGGGQGNAHQQSTHWTQSQARVSQALERIRQAIAVIHPRWEKLWGGRRRLWHLHRPYEPMEVAPWSKSMISAEA